MGIDEESVLICEDGDQVELSDRGLRRAGSVPAGLHYVAGGDGDLDETPLDERRMLAEFGVVQISAALVAATGAFVSPVRVVTRGWFDGPTGEQIREHLQSAVRDALTEALSEGDTSEERLNKVAQRAAGRLLGGRYRRQPVLLVAVTVL